MQDDQQQGVQPDAPGVRVDVLPGMDEIVTNKASMTASSLSKVLRAACLRLNLSQSGGKDRLVLKLFASFNEERLRAAHDIAASVKAESERRQVALHNLTHVPYRVGVSFLHSSTWQARRTGKTMLQQIEP